MIDLTGWHVQHSRTITDGGKIQSSQVSGDGEYMDSV